MRAAIIDFGSHFSERLVELVKGFADVEVLRPFQEPRGADLVVFSGRSMRSFKDNAMAFRLFRELSGTPAIGVCYGAEAYNLFAGGSLVRSEAPIKGLIKVRFSGAGFVEDGEYELYESRHYRVGRLGRGLRAVATSRHGVEAYVGDLFIGFLFHPEASGGPGRAVMGSAIAHLLSLARGGAGLEKSF